MKKNNFVIPFLTFCIIVLASIFLLEDENNIDENIAGVSEKVLLYEVTRIIDGDTIEVKKDEDEYKVRLIGIDTPETVHPNKSVECFGIEASNKLKSLIENKEVQLQTDVTQDDIDRYGRLLRYVYLDNIDINLEMIKQGFAFEYTYRIPYEKQEEYREAEKFARENKLGLWSE